MRRTLFVGLDGLSWDYLDSPLAANRLPHLSSLISMGSYGETISTLPAHTPTAWASIITGKNPGKHGVFDFRQPSGNGDSVVVTNATTRKGAPFWKYLNGEGVRVGLVNIPLTHPPQSIEGFTVCGFGTPANSPDIALPSQVKEWIAKKYAAYKPNLSREEIAGLSSEDLLDQEEQRELMQVEIAAEAAKKYSTDVLCVNLMLFDFANHKMAEYGLVNRAIEAMDRHLGMLIDSFAPDNVLAFSDHGSRRIQGDFMLNLWLRDRGYMDGKRTDDHDRAQVLNYILLNYINGSQGSRGIAHDMGRVVLREALLHLPKSMTASAWRRISQRYPLATEFLDYSVKADPDLSSVYALSAWSGLLYVNRSLKEAEQTMRSGAAEDLINELSRDLESIEDPFRGERLITSTYKASTLYEGDADAAAPDLILDHYSSQWNVSLGPLSLYDKKDVLSRYFVRNGKTFGVHGREGIFAFAGSDIARGEVLDPLQLVDLTATLVYLHQVPVPTDVDGRVAMETITPEYAEANELLSGAPDRTANTQPTSTYSTSEQHQVEEHLRTLGYLE